LTEERRSKNNKIKSEEKPSSNIEGSLINVGSGIQAVRHLTFESKFAIERADKVLYALYRKLGYREFKRLPVNDWIVLVFLEKYRNQDNL